MAEERIITIVNGRVVAGPGLLFDIPDAETLPWSRRYVMSAIRYKMSVWARELAAVSGEPPPSGQPEEDQT